MSEYTVYSYRVDMSTNDVNDLVIKDYVNRVENLEEYLFSRENKKDGTPHYQGYLKFQGELARKDDVYLRNIVKKPFIITNKEKKKKGGSRPYSLAKAKKRKSLLSYCKNKEGKGYVTNMSEEKIKVIPDWIPPSKTSNRKDLKKKFVDTFWAIDYGNEWNFREKQILDIVSHAYDVYDEADETPPRVTVLIGWLRRKYTKEQWLQLYYKQIDTYY
jgi:hypothetical protein